MDIFPHPSKSSTTKSEQKQNEKTITQSEHPIYRSAQRAMKRKAKTKPTQALT